MAAFAAVMVLRSEYSMPATKAIGWLAIAAAVTGASAVVAISAPPPSTVSRHCLPDVKLATEMSRPCFSNMPFALATMTSPEMGPRFCASRAFTRSCAVASVGAATDQQSMAQAANAAAGIDLARGMCDLHRQPGVLAACLVTMMAPALTGPTASPALSPCPGQPVRTIEVSAVSEDWIVGHGPGPRKQLIDIGRRQARRDAGVLSQPPLRGQVIGEFGL